MNAMVASIKNETEKLFLKKKNIIFIVLSVIITVAGALLISTFQGNAGISAIRGADYPILMLGIFSGFFLPVYIFMTAADSFAGEVGSRSIKLVLTRPVSRFKTFASKSISIAIYIISNLIVVYLSSIVCSFFINGSMNVLKGFFDGIIAYSTAVVPLIALIIAAVFISQLFKGSSGALTVSILVFAALKITGMFFPEISRLLLTSYTDWYVLWIGKTLPTGKIFEVFMFMCSYSIILFAGGYYLFDRKEI